MTEKKFSWVTDEDIAAANEKFDAAQKNYTAGKFLNAQAYCQSALRLNPADAKRINFLLGLIHLELGTSSSHWDFNDSIAACDYFDAVIELDPTCAEAYLYNGIAIVHWGNNYNLAKNFFDKTLELEPENLVARKYCEVCIKCIDDDFDAAQKLLNEAVELRGKKNITNLRVNQIIIEEMLTGE